jgi:hypothetical protein
MALDIDMAIRDPLAPARLNDNEIDKEKINFGSPSMDPGPG